MTQRRGGEFYEDDDVREAYLRHRHDGAHSPNIVMEEPAFLDALGIVAGARVLDLGCGDGTTLPLLCRAGASTYLGIDGSAAMVAEANEAFGSAVARFQHGDIEDFDATDESFDLVVSRMALHYLADLDAVIDRVRRALMPNGRFVFSVVHPTITSHDNAPSGQRTSWNVDDYFVRGRRNRSWFGSTVSWHHRTIEDHVRLLVERGFRLDVLSECEPAPSAFGDDVDELARRRRVPLMLLLAATKTSEPATS